MKKHLFILVLSLVLSRLNSQVVFCPPGAEWRYNFAYHISSQITNEKIAYTGDTILAGQSVKKLKHERFFTQYNSGTYVKLTLIKQSGDTIFMNNPRTKNKWQILYNFAAKSGDVWRDTLSDWSTTPIHYTVTVNSVDYTTVNSLQLKRLHVTYVSNTYGIPKNYEITERIGCSKYLFNYIGRKSQSDDDYIYAALCYKDDEFGLKQFSSTPCDYVNYVGLSEPALNSGLRVYPNPAASRINIAFSNSETASLEINNSLGQLVHSQVISSGQELDLQFLSSGIYFLGVRRGDERSVVKLIKE